MTESLQNRCRQTQSVEEKMILAIQSDLEKRFEHQDMSKLHIGTALTTAQQEEWLILLRNNSPKSAVFYSPLLSVFFSGSGTNIPTTCTP